MKYGSWVEKNSDSQEGLVAKDTVAQAWQPEFNLWNSHKGRRIEPIPQSHPLAFTHPGAYMPTAFYTTYTEINTQTM